MIKWSIYCQYLHDIIMYLSPISTWYHHLFINIYKISSWSSCRVISTDISDPLSPPLPFIHWFWQVFQATSSISTELLYVSSTWKSCLCSSLCRGPLEYITYEFVPTSLAVSRMSGSSNFDSFHDWWSVAVQLIFCGVLSPGLVQYSSQHSHVIAVKFFLHMFC